MCVNPCYQCNKRTSNCHGTCKEYLEFYEKNKVEREKRHKDAYIKNVCYPSESPHYRDGWMMKRPYCEHHPRKRR